MIEQTYIDDVGGIAIRDGVVRIDFVTFPPVPGEDPDKPVAQFAKRIFLTIPDFLRSFSKMREVMDKLVEAGVVERRQEGAPAPAEPRAAAPKPLVKPQAAPKAQAAAPKPAGGAVSPNFPAAPRKKQ